MTGKSRAKDWTLAGKCQDAVAQLCWKAEERGGRCSALRVPARVDAIAMR